MKNIHPVFDQILGRQDKEAILNQKSIALWFTGLSGSGKTTIARHVEGELAKRGFFTQVLDGDNIRSGINNNLGFSEEDRHENIRRIAEVTKLFINCGVITLNCFISPTMKMRSLARSIISDKNFFEIFVDTPLDICEQRDVKGLYKKARAGEIKHFTGIDSPFEEPRNPNLHVKTHGETIEHCTSVIIDAILPIISLRNTK